jgi:hypothetical protein
MQKGQERMFWLACVATGKNMDSHNKVNSLLMSDTSDRSDTSSPSDSCSVMAKEHMRKKCKSIRELKTYTGNSARKRSKTRDKVSYKGWSLEGKTFVVTIMRAIKDDVKSKQQGSGRKCTRRSAPL